MTRESLRELARSGNWRDRGGTAGEEGPGEAEVACPNQQTQSKDHTSVPVQGHIVIPGWSQRHG
jgi:hypothetical protein